MAATVITPTYRSEWSQKNVNMPCDSRLAAEIEEVARIFVRQRIGRTPALCTVMSRPEWQPIKGHRGWRGKREALVTNFSTEALYVFNTKVRTYGADAKGVLYVGRKYPELTGHAFLPIFPLAQCTLDLNVLQDELLPVLRALTRT